MADSTILNLDELAATPDGTDTLEIVDATVSKRITVTNLMNAGGGLTFAKVVKSADETITNSTTLQDDDELLFTPTINKTYGFMLFLLIANNSTPDLKLAFTVPSGATILTADSTWSAKFLQGTRDGTTATAVTAGTADLFLVIGGRVIMSSTAGTFNFQWTQNTSSATAEIVKQGSFLVVWEE